MTELRSALNKFSVQGAVKEANFNVVEGSNDNGSYKYVTGKLVIKAGETKEITVKASANELTKKGDINKTYETLCKFMNGEYPTMAMPNVTEEEATKVSIWGNGDFTPRMADNMFVVEGQLKEAIAFELGFGRLNIKDNLTPDQYKADFEIEMFVTEVEAEIKNDEETGRTVVKGYVPVYGGSAMPFKVIAEDIVEEDGEVFPFAQQVLEGVYPESTFTFWGDIRYERVETVIKKGGTLGRAKLETSTATVKEFVIVGGDIVDDYEKAYTIEQIQSALVERENRKAKEFERAEKREQANQKGRGLGGAKPSPMAKPTMAKPVAPVAKPAMPVKPTMATKPRPASLPNF